MMLDLFDEPVLPGLRLCRPDIFAGGLAFASPNTSPTVRLRRKDWSRIGVPDTSDTIAANSARNGDEDGSGMTKSKSARSEADATRISRARHDLGFPGWCDRKPSSRLQGMDQRIAVVASLTTPIAAEHVEERNALNRVRLGLPATDVSTPFSCWSLIVTTFASDTSMPVFSPARGQELMGIRNKEVIRVSTWGKHVRR